MGRGPGKKEPEAKLTRLGAEGEKVLSMLATASWNPTSEEGKAQGSPHILREAFRCYIRRTRLNKAARTDGTCRLIFLWVLDPSLTAYVWMHTLVSHRACWEVTRKKAGTAMGRQPGTVLQKKQNLREAVWTLPWKLPKARGKEATCPIWQCWHCGSCERQVWQKATGKRGLHPWELLWLGPI